jgi:hypothetical protein
MIKQPTKRQINRAVEVGIGRFKEKVAELKVVESLRVEIERELYIYYGYMEREKGMYYKIYTPIIVDFAIEYIEEKGYGKV